MAPKILSERSAVSAGCLTPWGDAASGLPGAAPEGLPRIMGFAISRFGPLVHTVVTRCLGPSGAPDNHIGRDGEKTAIVLATMYGDAVTVDTATQRAVADEPPKPLLFFQSVSTSILSHLTRSYAIHGPLVCISAVRDPAAEALTVADTLLDDPSLSQVLVIGVETEPNERVRHAAELAAGDHVPPRLPQGDVAAAILLRRFEGSEKVARVTLLRGDRDFRPPPTPLGWLDSLAALCAAVEADARGSHAYELPIHPLPAGLEDTDDHSRGRQGHRGRVHEHGR